MPTVVLLDVSLSMLRPVLMPDCNEEYQRRHLAIHGINTLLDFCTTHTKLEFMSLVLFSSSWEQLVPFTRDYDSIKTAMNKIGDFDKTCLEGALSGITSLVINEWGQSPTCQVVLVTDGSPGIGEGSLYHSIKTYMDRETSDVKFPLPFPFPCKLLVMCIAPPTDNTLTSSITLHQKLIDINGSGGEVFVPEGPLSLKSVSAMFTKMAEKYFLPYHGLLKCGNLNCKVQVFPAPEGYTKDRDFEHISKEINSTLEIIGYLDIGDVSSPPCISRHLMLPTSSHSGEPLTLTQSSSTNGTSKNEGEDEESEDGKTAAFTVLLHGSLKVEGMVALTQIADDWFGLIYSWADSKKKSNLMLSIYEPGADTLSWMGNLNFCAPISDFSEPPYGDNDDKTPFPVRPVDRRSYAQNCVVWIKPTGLQADIQKILRHARKLPEKQVHFYKELNRLRRAALSFGFTELLEAVSKMLERECTMLPGTAHPDAALQLTHAANALIGEYARDAAQMILPLRTNFSGD